MITCSPSEAATEIGNLVTRILALAPAAGLHVGIKIEPASTKRPSPEIRRAIAADHDLSLRECARKHGVSVGVVRGIRKATTQLPA
jgi:hypothetical protein